MLRKGEVRAARGNVSRRPCDYFRVFKKYAYLRLRQNARSARASVVHGDERVFLCFFSFLFKKLGEAS